MGDEEWDTEDETELKSTEIVALGRQIRRDGIAIRWNGSGFVASVREKMWSPYGLLSELLKDYGFGFRLVIPMVGIMGFDFAWNLGSDFHEGRQISDKGMQMNFVIEAPF